jgi:hypothetical protein
LHIVKGWDVHAISLIQFRIDEDNGFSERESFEIRIEEVDRRLILFDMVELTNIYILAVNGRD